MPKISTRNILFLIIGLGLLFRLWGLNAQDIWLDESLSIYHSQHPLHYIFTLKDPTPPLYLGLLHFWVALGGTDAWWARLFSAIFGGLGIFLMYLLSAKVFGRAVGLGAAFLISISPLFVYYSQEARVYSLLFALVLCSMYCYLKLREELSWKWGAAYVIITALMLYSHFYALFIVIAQNVDFIMGRRGTNADAKRWIMIQAAIMLLFLPWLFSLPSIIAEGDHGWIPYPSFLDIPFMFYMFFGGVSFSFSGLALTLAMVACALRGWVASSKKVRQFTAAWMLTPIILPLLFSLFFTPIFFARYALIASLPLFMLAAYAVANLPKKRKISAFILLTLLSMAAVWSQQHTITKEPWEDIAAQAHKFDDENATISIFKWYDIYPFSYYYSPHCFARMDIEQCLAGQKLMPLRSPESAALFSANQVILIISHEQFEKEAPALRAALEQRYSSSLLASYPLYGSSPLARQGHKLLISSNLTALQINNVRIYVLSARSVRNMPPATPKDKVI